MKCKTTEHKGRGSAVDMYPTELLSWSLGHSMAVWVVVWAAAIIGSYTHPAIAVAATGTAAYLSLRRPIAHRIHFILARYANPGSN